MNKLFKIAAWVGAVGAAIGTALATTLSPIAVPTSTAPDALAFVGGQLADLGTYTLLLLVIGVPFAFYIIHKIRAVVPKK